MFSHLYVDAFCAEQGDKGKLGGAVIGQTVQALSFFIIHLDKNFKTSVIHFLSPPIK